uniref:Peptidase aspartic putative domain-containing protein n=1 Tax=Trichogramma kaykai TaxID=54128 RepID=A0ABD2WLM0_9HYME
MGAIEDLIAAQVVQMDQMTRAFSNLKKKGPPTLGAIETRQRNLREKWQEVCGRHQEILKLQTAESLKLTYFTDSYFERAEEVFLDEDAKFIDATYDLRDGSVQETSGSEPSAQGHSSSRKLPAIQLPTFSGRYADWKSYKDMFQAMLTDNNGLTDVERLYYLKSSLTDEAAKTIKNIPVTEDNFKRAWDRLVDHYDNKRTLVYSALQALFQIPSVSKETSAGLRQLRDATNEAVETLDALERPVEHWDDVLVYWTLKRVDPRTGRDWQTSREDTKEPATYAQLDAFLKRRIEALEFVESPHQREDQQSNKKTINSVSTSRPGSSRISAHNASTQGRNPQISCTFCQESHYMSACDGFRLLDLNKRKSFVSENKLCYNCLGRHFLRDCRSSKSCRRCRGRHHTLLHADEPSVDGPLAAQDESGVSTHTANASAQRARVLLATARVHILSGVRRGSEVRALIDPCSEATFVSEALAQRLRLPRDPVFVPVSGIGGAHCQTSRHQTTITIQPRFDASRRWEINALILSHLSDYAPPRCALAHLDFASDLQLADDQLNSMDNVEIIIGADLYPSLIEPGVRKCEEFQLVAQATALGWIVTGVTLPQAGDMTAPNVTAYRISLDRELHGLLERFWLQEEVNVNSFPSGRVSGGLAIQRYRRAVPSGAWRVALLISRSCGNYTKNSCRSTYLWIT